MPPARTTDAASASHRPRPLATSLLPTTSTLLPDLTRDDCLYQRLRLLCQHRVDRRPRHQHLRGAGRLGQQLPLTEKEGDAVVGDREILIVLGVVQGPRRN